VAEAGAEAGVNGSADAMGVKSAGEPSAVSEAGGSGAAALPQLAVPTEMPIKAIRKTMGSQGQRLPRFIPREHTRKRAGERPRPSWW
jgi:hypothetical protein